MNEKLCPLILRNEYEWTDKGFVISTKLHPCIQADCELWVPGRYHNEGYPDFYETEGRCGLKEQS